MIDVNISLITTGIRYRKDFGDVQALADSISAIGLLHPIVIDSGYRLICGERRMKAFQLLGRETIPARFVNLDSIISGEMAENEVRKDFTPSERVAIGQALEAELGNRQGQRTDKLPQIFGEVKGKETTQLAAEKSGFGNPETYRQAKKVVEDATPEVVTAMDAGQVSVNLASQFVALPDEDKQEAIEAIAAQPEAAKDVMREAVKQYRQLGSGENEWYTPAEYADMAREVMGSIDLDPASCDEANKVVQATAYYTKEDDGLTKAWKGNLWVNPPYSRDLMPAFVEKLKQSFANGDVENAILLSHNNTDTAWFHSLASVSSAICFPKKRIKFYRGEEIAAPTNGQAFFYLGDNPAAFADVFGIAGFVVEPMHARAEE